MTGYPILGDLYVVGTDHKVGTWDGTGVDNRGYLGGWWIQQLTFDSDGTMWCVGTDHNVGKWNGKGWDNQGFPGGWWIQQILFAPDGAMWCVGTDHNVGKWNGKGWDSQGFPGGWWIQQILFAPDGAMWCVGTDHNVGKWNGKGWDNQGYLGGWWIQQLLFDADGIMWCVGTDHNVGKWNGSGWTDLRSIFKGDVTWITWKPHETASAFDNWTAPIANPGLASCLAYGMVWLGAGGTLYGFDHFTGKQTYAIGKFGANQTVRGVQPYDDGLLVYATDGYFYKASLTANAKPMKVAYVEADPFWMMAYRGSVYLWSQSAGLQRVPPASEDFTPGPNGRITLPYGIYGEGPHRDGTIPVVGVPSIGDGYLLVPVQSSGVDAVDAATLETLWTVPVPWGGGHLSSLPKLQTAFNGEYFCVASDARAISVVSVSKRKLAWTKSFAAELSAQPICDPRYCYVSLKTGQLLVLSVTDGKLVNTISLPGIYDRLIMEDGILYGVLDQYGYSSRLPIDIANSVFAVEVATGAIAAIKTNSGTALIAVENGVIYYHTADTVVASRLGKLVRTFYAEATLLQDFDFSGGASTSPKKPLINTEITLFKDDGTPQPQQHVRVGATAPATIESGGETYSIGPSAYASIPTDVTGRLRITMRAGEADDKNEFRDGLTTPALTLFTTFMGSNHRILIRPDAQLHDKLAGMETGALATARDYGGQPILSAKYQDKSKTDAVGSATQMIKGTLSMVKTSVNQRNRRRAITDDYLAPGCDTEAISCCYHDDYAVPMVCTSNFAFDLDQATFKDKLDERETQQWLETFQATGPVTRGLDDWLLKAIKNGTAAITSAIVYAEKAASAVKARLKAVINGIARSFELVLETIEQAVAVVHGIFNEIVGAIDKVLQAFSFAFSWNSILVLKEEIKDTVMQTWKLVLDGEPSRYDKAAAAILARVDDFRKQADQAFERMKGSDMAGRSIANERKQAIGDKNPAAGGSTDNWLQTKLNDNLFSERALQQSSAQTRSSAAQIQLPEFPIPPGMIEDLQGLIPRLGALVTPEVKARFQQIIDEFTPGSGRDLFTAAFSAIIDILRGTVDIAISLAKEALATLLRIIGKVLKAARDFVTNEITIPFISDLYHYFTHKPLTVLDMSALLVAVPLSLAIAATKFNNRHAELTPRDLADPSLREKQIRAGLGAGVSQVVWAGVSTGLEYFLFTLEKTKAEEFLKPIRGSIQAGVIVILVGGLTFVRGFAITSDYLEATGEEQEKAGDKEPDWLRVLKLAGPLTLAAAIEVAAALAKAWVIQSETKNEKLLKFIPGFSAIAGGILAFVDFVWATSEIGSRRNMGADDWLDLGSHWAEELSLGARIIALVPYWPSQILMIAASGALLAVSGILKIVASSPAVHARSAMA